MSNVIRVFWSGGFSSTFRVLELSRYEDIIIEPIYIMHNDRSEPSIIQTIKEVKGLLLSDSQFKASFAELVCVDSKSISPNREITEAYHKLSKDLNLDPEVELLARYAHSIGQKVEISFANVEPSYKYNRLGKIEVEEISVAQGRNYYVLTDESDKDIYTLFSNFYFSRSLFKMTQRDMYAKARERFSDSLLLRSWFCTMPINDQPCGVCEACQGVINAKMRFRLTAKAFRRGQRTNKYPLLKKYYELKTKLDAKINGPSNSN